MTRAHRGDRIRFLTPNSPEPHRDLLVVRTEGPGSNGYIYFADGSATMQDYLSNAAGVRVFAKLDAVAWSITTGLVHYYRENLNYAWRTVCGDTNDWKQMPAQPVTCFRCPEMAAL